MFKQFLAPYDEIVDFSHLKFNRQSSFVQGASIDYLSKVESFKWILNLHMYQK